MLAGIREILIISTERDVPIYRELLGDGSQLGISIGYAVQMEPKGIAESFIIGESFIGDDSVSLILGDNIFYGNDFSDTLGNAINCVSGATIFGYYVKNPTAFGVVEFDENKRVISLEEKPSIPKSNYAVPGLYFYDNDVVEIAKSVTPSARGELEITDVNIEYLKRGKLKVQLFGRGFSWIDAGNPDALLSAASFVSTVQKRQGLYVACIEEIAYNRGFIDKEQLLKLADNLKKTDYGQYLYSVAEGDCVYSRI